MRATRTTRTSDLSPKFYEEDRVRVGKFEESIVESSCRLLKLGRKEGGPPTIISDTIASSKF